MRAYPCHYFLKSTVFLVKNPAYLFRDTPYSCKTVLWGTSLKVFCFLVWASKKDRSFIASYIRAYSVETTKKHLDRCHKCLCFFDRYKSPGKSP